MGSSSSRRFVLVAFVLQLQGMLSCLFGLVFLIRAGVWDCSWDFDADFLWDFDADFLLNTLVDKRLPSGMHYDCH